MSNWIALVTFAYGQSEVDTTIIFLDNVPVVTVSPTGRPECVDFVDVDARLIHLEAFGWTCLQKRRHS